MASVIRKKLNQYCAEAERLIEAGSPEAAVAIGQHILRHYPKYIEAYRVIAKATLEQGELGHAADLFKRVLSADPEDLEARVGLGIVYNKEAALEEALWQWERAFELSPGNSDIRAQLRQVREELEGKQVPRIELTRGALGRLYAQGGLFEQAAAEFQAVLDKNPDQIDVRIALAETLWRNKKWAAAEAECKEILEALPNCLKANLILGDIWRQTGREEESNEPFRLAHALDPENQYAVNLLGEESPLTKETVLIPQAEQLPREAPKVTELIAEEEEQPPVGWAEEETLAEAELPDWLAQLRETGIEEEPLAEGGLPDWLTTPEPAEAAAPAIPFPEVKAPPPEPEPAPEAQDKTLPEWLAELGEAEAAPQATEEEALPDWLADLETVEAKQPAAQTTKTELSALEPEFEAEPMAEDEALPEWLAALQFEETKEFSTAESPKWEAQVQDLGGLLDEEPVVEELDERDVPEWLRQLRTEMEQDLTDIAAPDVTAPPAEQDTGRFASRDVPEWLRDVQKDSDLPIEAISEEEILSSDAEPAQVPPDQLAALEVEEPVSPQVISSPEEEKEEESPDWLAALQAAEPTAPEIPETLTEVKAPSQVPEEGKESLDWLAALQAEELAEVEVEERLEPAEPAEEIPDWLKALQPEETAMPEEAEAPAGLELDDADLWRQIMREEELEELIGAVPAEAEGLSEPTEEDEIPDWLAALQPEETAVPEEAEALVGPELDDAELWRQIMREEELEELIEAVPAETEGLSEPAQEEESLDWLAALQAEELAEVEVEERLEPAEPAEEIPDWLKALQPEETAMPEEAEAPAGLELDDADLWRQIMREEELEELIGAVPAEAEGLSEPVEEEEVSDWLAALQAEELAEPESLKEPPEPAEAESTETERWREILRQEGLDDMVEAIPAETVPNLQPAEEEETPDWLVTLQAEELAGPEIAQAEAELEEMPESAEAEPTEAERWREILRQEGLADMVEAAPSQAEQLLQAAEEEEIPDWLAALQARELPELTEAPAEAKKQPETTQPAEKVGKEERSIPEWLAGWQEEAESVEADVRADVETEMAVPETVEEKVQEAEVEEAASFVVASYLTRLKTHPNDHEVRLALARAYRDEKKLDKAFEQFETLVNSGKLTKEFLPDLERLCTSHPTEASWHQLLGDAYTRVNRLSDALKAYRAAQAALYSR